MIMQAALRRHTVLGRLLKVRHACTLNAAAAHIQQTTTGARIRLCPASMAQSCARIKHYVDGITVYVRSDDDSCYHAPYDVWDLLCLVPLAYDNWGALLDFV